MEVKLTKYSYIKSQGNCIMFVLFLHVDFIVHSMKDVK